MPDGWLINTSWFDDWIPKMWAEIRAGYRAFLQMLAPVAEFNPLPLIARSVNSVLRRFVIKQPCWRKGRWRSKT